MVLTDGKQARSSVGSADTKDEPRKRKKPLRISEICRRKESNYTKLKHIHYIHVCITNNFKNGIK